jgi:hypothetical protein
VRDVSAALAAGLRAPVRRWRLVLVLWLGRLLPVVLFFGLPAYGVARARLSHHPDATRLLDPAADEGGFSFAWLSDTFRHDLAHAPDRVFWLILFTWLFVAVLAGGITTRLIHGRTGGFWAECGHYSARFVRLALTVAVLFYLLDAAVNAVLAEAHQETARMHHAQDYAWRRTWLRGALFLTLLQILGAVHSYARIEIVARERRSALLSFFRGVGTLVVRFPKLLVLEVAMLLAAGVAALLAWVLMGWANPLTVGATWLTVGAFLLLAAVGSYLRTGIEVGTLEARCHLLVPPAEAPLLPQVETVPSLGPEEPEEPEDLELPPAP